ncbi:MAG: hypothetical protein ACSHYF_16195 [Verrucomicrobiaceae bacterium]
MKTGLLLTALIGTAAAQCPLGPSPHFMCTSAGGNTDITLFNNADLNWTGFTLPATDSLNITSAGGPFASTHHVSGTALIDGSITSDGPFTLIAPRGIRMNGTIHAPAVTLSTLPLTGGNFQGSLRVRDMIVNGDIHASSGDLTLLSLRQTIGGNLEAPSGKVTLISAETSTVSQADLSITPASGSLGGAQVRTRGTITAPTIEIYSDGFISNSGRFQTSAPGNSVTLTAPFGVAHDNRPGSLIQTGQLTVNQGFTSLLEGPIEGPQDGSNPGGVSGVSEIPDLKKGTFTAKRKTTLLPTQFSSSNVSQSQLPSVLKKSPPRPATTLATRGSTSKKSAKKRSFFGLVTKKD